MSIKIGDTIRNNDPRKKGETVKVDALVTFPACIDPDAPRTHVVYWAKDAAGKKTGRVNRIAINRVFTDGRARAKGWNLVEPAHGV